MTKSFEERLARLEDISEIHSLIGRYSLCFDDGFDSERLRAIFTEGATWETTGFGGYSNQTDFGIDSIVASQKRITSNCHWVHHIFSCNFLEALDGKSARGSWNLLGLGTWSREDETDAQEALVFTATFKNQFEKIDAHWLISSIRIEIHQVSPVQKGWVEEPAWRASSGHK